MNNSGYFGSLNGSVSVLLGAGRSNIALASYLSKHGVDVLLCDKNLSENDIVKIVEENKIENCIPIKYGATPKADFVFRTPVMRPDDELIAKLVSRGACLTSETELFFEKCRGKIYGITGSDGKTTTATITSELYKNQFASTNQKVFLGGNIGVPLINFVDEIGKDDIVIAELSSFQLMTARRSSIRSAITNITENHLDWHVDKQEYISSKANIYAFFECESLVTEPSAFYELSLLPHRIPSEVILTQDTSGIHLNGKSIYFRDEKLLDISDIFIKGEHNVKNIMTALSLSYPDISRENIINTTREFKGVTHRIEFVDKKYGISFYNSSIDSTPSRTLNTLKCFDGNVTLICGGYDKNLDYSELAEYVNMHIKNLVLYGEAAEKIYSSLKIIGNTTVNIFKEEVFDKAFEKAVSIAEAGGTVLLSPACASFDQFKNFEERGERFSALVRAL